MTVLFKYWDDKNLRIFTNASLSEESIPDCEISHGYYQWVPYIFVMIGLMCLAPHYGQ